MQYKNMTITIYEGADYVGKTTKAITDAKQNNGIYVHFPIRYENDVRNYSCVPCKFTYIAFESLENISQIQEIILQNIINNCEEILRLHKNNANVFIDRFAMSNYVYRKLLCSNMSEDYFDAPRKNLLIVKVLSHANINILTCSIEIIKDRMKDRIESETYIDIVTEKYENIERALILFASIDKFKFCIE
jgi:hypothetical protein